MRPIYSLNGLCVVAVEGKRQMPSRNCPPRNLSQERDRSPCVPSIKCPVAIDPSTTQVRPIDRRILVEVASNAQSQLIPLQHGVGLLTWAVIESASNA